MDEVSISFDAGQNMQHRKVPRGGPIPPFVPARPAAPTYMGGPGGGTPGWGPAVGGRGSAMGLGGPTRNGPGSGVSGLGPGPGGPGMGLGPGGTGSGGLGPGMGGGGPGAGPGMAFMSFDLGNTAGRFQNRVSTQPQQLSPSKRTHLSIEHTPHFYAWRSVLARIGRFGRENGVLVLLNRVSVSSAPVMYRFRMNASRRLRNQGST